MMRAEAAPSVPDSTRSARVSATSIDSRSPASARMRALRADEAGQQLAQLVDARGVGRRLALRLFRLGAQHEGVGLLGGPRRDRPRTSSDTPTSSSGIDQDADDEALAHRIELGERRRQVGLQRRHLAAAGGLAQGRQQQRVEPDDEAAGQAGDDAVAMRTAPVEAEHEAGREVGDGAEADQADRGERQVARDDALVGVARHQDQHDGGAAHEHHQRAHLARDTGPPYRAGAAGRA